MVLLHHIECRYGTHRALDHVDLELQSGRSLLLGPNGAGKSTLFKVLSGELRPHSGRIDIGGQAISPRMLASHVALMPQEITPLRNLRVDEFVAYHGWLRGLSAKVASRRAAECLEATGLAGLARRSSSALSGGERRRMGLAAALVAAPTVLLLDEPTAGLDPLEKERFHDVLRSLPEDLTLAVSTHELSDEDDLFQRVIVLDHGRVVWQGSFPDFLDHDPDHRSAREAFLTLMRSARA